MQPINYSLQGETPTQALMGGFGSGMGIAQAQEEMRQSQAAEARAAEMQPLRVQSAELGIQGQQADLAAAEQAQAAAAAEQARAEAFRETMSALHMKGTNATRDDFQSVLSAFPEYGEAISESMEGVDETRREGAKLRLGQIAMAIKSGDTDLAVRKAREYAEAARNSGEPALADAAEAVALQVETSPDVAFSGLGLLMEAMGGSLEGFDMGGGVDTARVQSSDTIAGRLSVQTMTDGTVRVVDTATNEVLTGPAAQRAIEDAERAGILEQGARAGARTGGALEAEVAGAGAAEVARGTGKLQVEFVERADQAASNVSGSIRTMQRAIDAIDDGAASGVVARMLPDVTQASAELNNALNKMGLDVIGSVTFGALSEGEMRLAMDVAAPRGLRGPQLRAWLVERQEAQEKVLAAVQEQARFLSNPENSLADWYEKVYEANDAPDDGGAPASNASPDASKWGDLQPPGPGWSPDMTREQWQRVLELGKRRNAGEQLSDDETAFIRGLTAR